MEHHVSVILVSPEKPGNLGAIARSIMNFGFEDLIMVDPRTPITEESRNYAVHALEILDKARIIRYPSNCVEAEKERILKKLFRSFDLLVGTSCRIFKERTMHRIPITLREFIEDMEAQIDPSSLKLGIIFGPESSGLPNHVLKLVDILVTIPTSEAYASMNLSHAVSVFLYELSMLLGTGSSRREDIPLCSKKNRALLFEFFNTMVDFSSLPDHRTHRARKSFHSIISRAHVSSRELTLLLGVFRNCVEAISKGGKANRDN